MAWNLEIHTIDVAQGESSLFVAYTDDGTQFRTMLIDGGLAKYGRLVDNYVAARLGGNPVDVMITTHYDQDHSGGHISLFLADNLSNVAVMIANEVAIEMQEEADKPSSQIKISIAGIAAYAAVVAGAYDDGTDDWSFEVHTTVEEVLGEYNTLPNPPKSTRAAMEWGLKAAFEYLETVPQLNPSLLRTRPNGATKKYGLATVGAALQVDGQDERTDAAKIAFFEVAAPPITQGGLVQAGGNRNYNFFTNQRYRETRVYNPGRVPDIPVKDLAPYFNALTGSVAIGVNTIIAPNLPRADFRIPNLGQELWGTPDGAPKAYCVAVGGNVLGSNVPVGGDPSNAISVGVVVVFGEFLFYTGGDLPVEGINMIPNAINQVMGAPTVVPGFKSGHHGSEESNSQVFIDDTLPTTSIISVGSRAFNGTRLPSDSVTGMLTTSPSIKNFYLTNCKVQATGVPASAGEDQLVAGNKSRLAGDNGFDPGEEVPEDILVALPKAQRGNIVLAISAAEATSTIHPPTVLDDGATYRQFRVTYWENEDNPALGAGNPMGQITDTLTF